MIVVTGLGAVTALGATRGGDLRSGRRRRAGLRELSLFPAEGYRARIVAEVADTCASSGAATASSRTSELALVAAREAIAHAGPRRAARGAVGLVVGGTTAGMFETESILSVLLARSGSVDPAARARSARAGC